MISHSLVLLVAWKRKIVILSCQRIVVAKLLTVKTERSGQEVICSHEHSFQAKASSQIVSNFAPQIG